MNAIQKIEPKIKITKRGRWFRYCYVNNINNIVNYDNKYYETFDLKSKIIKALKNHKKIIKALENYKKQELTAMEIAQLLLSANSK
ncbi:hypothetical protein [Candidatus Rickettsia colombianensi]|uniref:hypothetical protein n=1 Tax=Candidatus Rickettsia colombianensi TaxID=1090944 RepID=UPI001FE3A84F|nr:hypothetical protein [Candidatus Rickettsia colombianensi]